ncbi:hypothetical protein LILAB_11375 [Corallococcus macrosporus]|uniref:Uncharacterized protein n=2 Tax=Myxococcaceae TaxID=31 RepID=F8CQ63_MYXFH|nr:hypothetical protein LILAB_11375 [Corallococcus macrosporus]
MDMEATCAIDVAGRRSAAPGCLALHSEVRGCPRMALEADVKHALLVRLVVIATARQSEATMALRLQLAPRALRTLAGCPTPVREKLQCELGALAAGLPLDGPLRSDQGGLVVLDSGFRVRYQLDLGRGLLRLTHVAAPALPQLWPEVPPAGR